MLKLLNPKVVEYQKPYLIRCFRCHRVIVGNTPDEVIKEAQGWQYDYGYKQILSYCPFCIKERERERERKIN